MKGCGPTGAGRGVELVNLRGRSLRGDEEIAIRADRQAGHVEQVVRGRDQRREPIGREIVALDTLVIADVQIYLSGQRSWNESEHRQRATRITADRRSGVNAWHGMEEPSPRCAGVW